MELEKVPRLKALPPEEHAIGIYIGLIISGLVLGIGALVLFKGLLFTFASDGIKITNINIFRTLLFLASAFGSMACFFAVSKLISLQRMHVKKVDDTFKDFTIYARPLIEEVIQQRIISEKLLEKLDRSSKSGADIAGAQGSKYKVKPPNFKEYARRGEFLVFISILASMTTGLFIYLERHPWGLVPYSVILLAIAWWFVVAKYFDLVYDIRSYYIPSFFVLLMPSLSILLRAVMLPYQAVYTVFIVLFFYVWSMYTYLNYIDTGSAPRILSTISSKLAEFPHSGKIKKMTGRETLSPRATELFPPKKYKGSAEKEDDHIPENISELFPQRDNNRTIKEKEVEKLKKK